MDREAHLWPQVHEQTEGSRPRAETSDKYVVSKTEILQNSSFFEFRLVF